MIRDALLFIIGLLNDFINPVMGSTDDQVVPGNIALLDAFNDSSTQNVNNKIVASIVNIQQEGTLRNLPNTRTITGEDGLPKGIRQSPEIYLNVYVLFAANNTNYDNALFYISKVIGFFQQEHVFTPATHPGLNPNIEKLILDLYSMSFEELNQLWSIMGGKYTPSVMYKMRMLAIQEAEESDAGIIRSLGTTPNSL
ncbi:MAG TPA: DUF4255 domain-containing protein [Saprospiraceae bacterium]|nr:DUF4255 domain-containing protein [Saprospiraceae bacterium]HMQ82139.1 DUF4255 domain-containing protein [Saprospiraceae bacterium]